MNLESFLSRIEVGENLEIEFKSAIGGLSSKLWETVSAFANTNGGWVLLGIADTSSGPQLQGLRNAAGMHQDIVNQMRNPQKISTEVCGSKDVRVENLSGAEIIVMRVRAVATREKPVFINGNPYTGTFVRRHEGDYRCTKQEVDRMIRDASAESADKAILAGYEWDAIDTETFGRYRQQYRQLNPASPWNAYDDLRFMRSLGSYRQDPETKQEGITRAAVLMFSAKEALLSVRSRHLIDYRLLPSAATEAEQRWEHRIAWEGNLYDAFFQIYPRLVEPLRTPFKLSGPHRLNETKAHEALRESLVNMLAHADYSEQAALLVKASPVEFVFRNPGSSRVSEDDLLTGDRSDPRNPLLLRMFRHVGLAEEAGTGLPKILQIWREARLQMPSVISDTERYEFILTLRLIHLLSEQDRDWLAFCASYRAPDDQQELQGITPLSEQEQLVLIHARNQGSVNNAAVQAQTGLHRADVTDLLTNLRKRGLLHQISSRRWVSYKLADDLLFAYTSARETYKQKPVSKIYKEKPPTKTERLRAQILDFCAVPRRADEIATQTGKNRIYLVTHYLTPLVKDGSLRYTNPAYPKARNQKYVAVQQKATPQ